MDRDIEHMRRAVELALEAEASGNLPIGAVIALDGAAVAEGWSTILVPRYRPGGHAEMEALARVDPALWPRAGEMTCYTTLEPCAMCFGAMLLHGIGRVVFGARDVRGGAGCLLAHLPEYYAGGRGVFEWVGPLLPEVCDPLYRRTAERFDRLPCGAPPEEG